MTLKVTERTIKEVEYHDLDNFVNEHLFNGMHIFEIVPMEELNNDSVSEFVVDGEVDDYEDEEIQEYIATGGKRGMYLTSAILNYLCRKGLLDKGDYLISICW